MLPPVFLDGIDHAAENRVGFVKCATAAGPLRTLSGKYHSDPSLTFIDYGDGGWIFLKAP